MKSILRCLCSFILFTAVSLPAFANGKIPELVIGITEVPPYIILENNQVSGAVIDLWGAVADSMHMTYRYKKFETYPELMDALHNGTIDMSLIPRTITRERLSNSRLTVPFLDTRVGILMKRTETFPFFMVLKTMMNIKFLKIGLVTLFIILFFSTLIWLLERRKNHQMFHHGISGVLDGMWWAVVTMTTVGYGDKVPQTKLGRLLTVFWMFYAIGLLFLLTSEISSELTVTKLQPESISISSLGRLKTSTLVNTGYAEMLKANGINYLAVNTVDEGIKLLEDGKIDAFMLDRNILDYIVSSSNLGKEYMVVGTGLNRQFLCFVIPKNETGLLNRINPALLEVIATVRWKEILANYNIAQ
jgi:polar amino acid transport system substrate-binding protein